MQKKSFRKWAPLTYDQKTRSVQAILATENPVVVFDYIEGRNISEILLMSGATWSQSGQVPFLDSHQRDSTRNVLGSCRNIRIENEKVIADIHFSDDTAGQAVEKKYRDGHLTDLSIGASIIEFQDVAPGQTANIEGRSFEGPVRVVTKSEIFEASAVAIGADRGAIARSKNYKEFKKMENENQKQEHKDNNDLAGDPIQAERTRVKSIMDMCRTANLPKFAGKFIDEGTPLDQVGQRLFAEMARINPPFGPGAIASDVTDYTGRSEAMIDGLVLRAGFKLEKPAKGADYFKRSSILDIAKTFVKEHGREDVRMMGNDAIVRKAFTLRSHTTADFPFILANVANKVLRVAYENSPATFEHWTVKGSGENFKELSRTQLSEAPGLDEVKEKAEYTFGTFGESREVFKIKKHGKLFQTSWESLVNDDLNAFSRVARAFVQSARRTLNRAVYSELTDNNNMSDGNPLFDNSNHGNLASSGAAIAIATLSAARLAMRTQSGLQTDDPLNIEPKFLIVPASLETESDQIINTLEGYTAEDGPGVRNPFYKKLIVLPEPFLDTVDTAAWYLSADPKYFDTLEVAYLDGNEFPYIEEENGFLTDSWTFKIRYCWGICPLDWRGLYKNPGAGG